MKKLIKRYVRQRIALHFIYDGADTAKQYADFVFNAPIRYWRFRLKLVLKKSDTPPIEALERLFRFACH